LELDEIQVKWEIVIVDSIFTSPGVSPSSCLVDKILLELSSLRSKAYDLIR
jgi:hypothetical protein